MSKKLIQWQLDLISTLSPKERFKKQIQNKDSALLIAGHSFAVSPSERLVICGAGKSAFQEASALLEILKDKFQVSPGVVITKYGHADKAATPFKVFEAAHPICNDDSVSATKELVEYLSRLNDSDTLLFCLSGGTSALLELPMTSLKEIKESTEALLKSGASIHEINKVRTKLSQVKGGKLASHVTAKRILVLITSDVPGDDIETIGSGPFYGSRASHIISANYQTLIDNCLQKSFEDVEVVFENEPLNQRIEEHLQSLPTKVSELKKLHKRFIYITGGELGVEVKGTGVGGRNTHYVLAAAKTLFDSKLLNDLAISSIGTDGTDGPTEYAGGYLSFDDYNDTDVTRALGDFDSLTYLRSIDRAIKTGPTGTNICDFRIIAKL